MKFSMTMSGSAAVVGDLRWMAMATPKLMARGIKRGALLIENHLREVSLSGRGPSDRTLNVGGGGLRRGVGQTEADDGLTRYVGPDKFYILTHEGMVSGVQGNHVVIEPKHAKALAFPPTRKSKQLVFAKRVRIPIRRPVAYSHEQTMADAQREAWRTVQAALREKARGASA